jgi:hypothetical protein
MLPAGMGPVWEAHRRGSPASCPPSPLRFRALERRYEARPSLDIQAARYHARRTFAPVIAASAQFHVLSRISGLHVHMLDPALPPDAKLRNLTKLVNDRLSDRIRRCLWASATIERLCDPSPPIILLSFLLPLEPYTTQKLYFAYKDRTLIIRRCQFRRIHDWFLRARRNLRACEGGSAISSQFLPGNNATPAPWQDRHPRIKQ